MDGLKEIESRDDVSVLVTDFYGKVRKDETIGPIFNSIIENWEAHLEKLTDFWTMQLFGGKIYVGNPIEVHQSVDSHSNNELSAFHFGTWINLWYEAIDAKFTGDNAALLKHRARKMQTPIMIAIYEGRKKI